MARPVYSAQLLFISDGTAVEEVTVPAGVRWVVREIITTAKAGASGSVAEVLVDGVVIFLHDYVTGDTDGLVTQQFRRTVLNPGQVLEFEPAGGTWDVLISGYVLTLP